MVVRDGFDSVVHPSTLVMPVDKRLQLRPMKIPNVIATPKNMKIGSNSPHRYATTETTTAVVCCNRYLTGQKNMPITETAILTGFNKTQTVEATMIMKEAITAVVQWMARVMPLNTARPVSEEVILFLW